MTTTIDQPEKVRQGEELDTATVEEYLKQSLPGLNGSFSLHQFPKGYSNLTYLVKIGNQELILRRPPFGRKAKTAHDMGREYRMLKALKPVFPYCPRPLLYTEDTSIIGCPFYVMERLQGIIIRQDLPPGMELSPKQARTLCENLISVLCKLHAIDYKAVGLADYGKAEGYVRRQVEGWSRRYRDARTPDAPEFEKVMQWLYDHMPADTDSPAVIHNDYKFDNLVLDPNNPLTIIGVLDWEMSTIGDPLMDLGASLGYWITPNDPEKLRSIRHLPTTIDGMLSREEIASLYAAQSGRRIESFDFYYCFGLFRLAVIIQQIYYRFFHGQTKDERFRRLVSDAAVLEDAALRVIAKLG